jgi:hypothetical protein
MQYNSEFWRSTISARETGGTMSTSALEAYTLKLWLSVTDVIITVVANASETT